MRRASLIEDRQKLAFDLLQPTEEHSAGKQMQDSMSYRSGSNVGTIELKRDLEGHINNPLLLSHTASRASLAPFDRMPFHFWVILCA